MTDKNHHDAHEVQWKRARGSRSAALDSHGDGDTHRERKPCGGSRTLRTALLLAIMIWAFARAYYFAFYVIEHYIDPHYRFPGLLLFLRYLISRRG